MGERDADRAVDDLRAGRPVKRGWWVGGGPWWKVLAGLAVAAPLAAQTPYDDALAAFGRNDYERAARLAQRAAAAEPQRGDVQMLVGDIACATATGGGPGALAEWRKCGTAYRRGIQLSPDSLAYLESLAGFLEHAPRAAGGDKDSAFRVAEGLRARDAGRGTYLLAGMLSRGTPAQRLRADSLMDALGQAHPADFAIAFRVADYWTNTRKPERALAAYRRLVDADPDNVLAQYFLGRQMVVMKVDPRGAQEHLLHATGVIAPPPPAGPIPTFAVGAPWWRLGQTYELLGMPDSARWCFEGALSLNPQFTEAKLSLDSLDRRARGHRTR